MSNPTASQLSQNSAPPVPPEAARFSLSTGLAWFLFFVGVLCFALSATNFVLGVTQKVPLLVLPALIVFFLSILCFRSFVQMRGSSAAVSEEGIWFLPGRSAPTFLSWREVASVHADDTMQRLILKDASGARTICLEYQLQNFRQLRDYVLAHTSAINQLQAATLKVFHRTWINKIILSVFGAVFAVPLVSSLIDRDEFFSVILSVVVALCLALVLWDPTRVLIVPAGIVIQSLAWKRTVPFDSIQQITVSNVADRGNVWAVVTIVRKKDRPIKLFRFREGSIVLHDALELAWRSATGA